MIFFDFLKQNYWEFLLFVYIKCIENFDLTSSKSRFVSREKNLMEKLWAPWRKEFISGKKEKGCIFCNKLKEKKDKKNLVLFRGKLSFVVMNKYPYNSGHLMVAPYRHTGKLEELKHEELSDLARLTQKCVMILKKTMKPHGFNLGMNLQKISGAGVADHLHLHIVPRWTGDTNFMPAIAGANVLPEHLRDTYAKLAPGFDAKG